MSEMIDGLNESAKDNKNLYDIQSVITEIREKLVLGRIIPKKLMILQNCLEQHLQRMVDIIQNHSNHTQNDFELSF